MVQDMHLCNGIFLNKKQMKPLAQSIILVGSLKVHDVRYIFNIDILVN